MVTLFTQQPRNLNLPMNNWFLAVGVSHLWCCIIIIMFCHWTHSHIVHLSLLDHKVIPLQQLCWGSEPHVDNDTKNTPILLAPFPNPFIMRKNGFLDWAIKSIMILNSISVAELLIGKMFRFMLNLYLFCNISTQLNEIQIIIVLQSESHAGSFLHFEK